MTTKLHSVEWYGDKADGRHAAAETLGKKTMQFLLGNHSNEQQKHRRYREKLGPIGRVGEDTAEIYAYSDQLRHLSLSDYDYVPPGFAKGKHRLSVMFSIDRARESYHLQILEILLMPAKPAGGYSIDAVGFYLPPKVAKTNLERFAKLEKPLKSRPLLGIYIQAADAEWAVEISDRAFISAPGFVRKGLEILVNDKLADINQIYTSALSRSKNLK